MLLWPWALSHTHTTHPHHHQGLAQAGKLVLKYGRGNPGFRPWVTTLHACPSSPRALRSDSPNSNDGVCGSRLCTLPRSPTPAPTTHPHILHSLTTQVVHFLASLSRASGGRRELHDQAHTPGEKEQQQQRPKQQQQPWSAFCTSSARCSASSPRWQRPWTGRSRSVRRSCGRS